MKDVNNKIGTDTVGDRLYYLDWSRIILILGVFLYHATRPFAATTWHIVNADKSAFIWAIMYSVAPWAMSLFFFIAGAGSMFALKRRSNLQFTCERITRLLVPFIVGTFVLSPIQIYLEALSKGIYHGSFFNFIPKWLTYNAQGDWLSPGIFGQWGLHLWFLGYLFSFSLLALPLFWFFRKKSGQAILSRFERIMRKKGAILLIIIPLALARIVLQPLAPGEHAWFGFVYYFIFFICGYLFFSNEGSLEALRRNRWIVFSVGIAALTALYVLLITTGGEALEWFGPFIVPESIIINIIFATCGWCLTIFILSLAMARMNFSNKTLVYGNEIIMPFYLLHQPVIIVISYFTVRLAAGILPKILIVIVGSFLVSIGLVELLIRHIRPMRVLLGMKPRKFAPVEVNK
jgi:glucans biosynthesis protein C